MAPCLLAWLTWTAVLAAPENPAEVAGLFPAQPLAYVEVRAPERLAQEVGDLVTGSALADFPFSLAPLLNRDPNQPPRGPGAWAPYGMLLSPETRQAARGLRGAAVALLRITRSGQPEFAGVIRTGDSPLPGLLLRGLLGDQALQPGAAVDGVPVFQCPLTPAPGAPVVAAEDDAPPAGELTLAVARLPGLIVFGTAGGVPEVIRRARGRVGGATLADQETYRRAVQAHGDRPGLLALADPGQLTTPVPPAWRSLARLLPAEAVHGFAAHLILEQGQLTLRGQLLTKPGVRCPLLDALPAGPPPDLRIPGQADFVAAFGNTAGARRWERWLEVADGLVKASDANVRLPSRQIDRIEDDLDLKLGKEVLDRLTGGVVARIAAGDRPGEAAAWLVLARTADEASAQTLVNDLAPRLAGALAGQRVAPTSVESQGRTIQVYGSGEAAWAVGRNGTLLAVGQGARLVAATLGAPNPAGDSGPVVARIGVRPHLILDRLRSPSAPGPALGAFVVPAEVGPPPAEVPALTQALANLPEVKVTLSRPQEGPVVELVLAGLRPIVPRLIDAWIQGGPDTTGGLPTFPVRPALPGVFQKQQLVPPPG